MRTLFRVLWTMASVSLLCGCQATFFRTMNTGDGGTKVSTYTYSAEHALQLDVYSPAKVDANTPTVLFFYGGSWHRGERGEYAFVGRALAAHGAVTVIADYRKYPQGRFPIFEEDAAKAARWTIDHAADFGGNGHVFLAGHSAGAQIAALLATDAKYLAAENLKPADFAGAIGIAGPYDFLPLTDPELVEVFGDESEWPASQPVRFVNGDEPPFLLLQGDRDKVVDPRNALSMARALRAAKVPVESKRYPHAGHFRILAALRYTSMAPTLADVMAFVRTTSISPPRAAPSH